MYSCVYYITQKNAYKNTYVVYQNSRKRIKERKRVKQRRRRRNSVRRKVGWQLWCKGFACKGTCDVLDRIMQSITVIGAVYVLVYSRSHAYRKPRNLTHSTSHREPSPLLPSSLLCHYYHDTQTHTHTRPTHHALNIHAHKKTST